jgi:hypothetical protein
MENKDYPLICDFCSIKESVKSRKIYKVQITEILASNDDSKYAHRDGSSRRLQICEHCFKFSALNEILHKENREFK